MASEPSEIWGDLATSAFVESSHLFKTLDAEARRDLLQVGRLQTFSAGEVLVAQGGEGDDFFLVREGTADLSAQRDGRSTGLAHLERGAFFGEMALLAGSPYRTTATARTDVTVVRFPAPVIAALAERFPKLQQLLEAVGAAREKEAATRLG